MLRRSKDLEDKENGIDKEIFSLSVKQSLLFFLLYFAFAHSCHFMNSFWHKSNLMWTYLGNKVVKLVVRINSFVFSYDYLFKFYFLSLESRWGISQES